MGSSLTLPNCEIEYILINHIILIHRLENLKDVKMMLLQYKI